MFKKLFDSMEGSIKTCISKYIVPAAIQLGAEVSAASMSLEPTMTTNMYKKVGLNCAILRLSLGISPMSLTLKFFSSSGAELVKNSGCQ